MTPAEKAQHEAFKQLWKALVYNNPSLTPIQKQQACDNIDRRVFEAEVMVELLRSSGLIG